mmetsp:Transcript_59826/g.175523  ORF Transcript_59826/g.175523 Transcript_59826/m.175523 type:complete len:221 (-) Transcript_59826:1641-2303(-)
MCSSTKITASSRDLKRSFTSVMTSRRMKSCTSDGLRPLKRMRTPCSAASFVSFFRPLAAETSMPSKCSQSKTAYFMRWYGSSPVTSSSMRRVRESVMPCTEAKKTKPRSFVTMSHLFAMCARFFEARPAVASWVVTSAPVSGLPAMADTLAYFLMKVRPVRRTPTPTAYSSCPLKMKTARITRISIHSTKFKIFREPQRFSQTKPAPAKKSSDPRKTRGR